MNPWDVLARQLTRLGDRIDALPSVREATVTGLSPLEVRFDTDTTGTVVFGTLVSGVRVGDRVLTVRLARYVWVLGVRGGTGWVAYTPTLTGMSLGDGTILGKWCRIGDTVHYKVNITWGSTTTFTSGPTWVSLPTPPKDAYNATGSDAVFLDTGSNAERAIAYPTSGGMGFYGEAPSSPNRLAIPTASFPFTWAATDRIEVGGTYEAA